jgi:starvation-inducible DNA-binding protein
MPNFRPQLGLSDQKAEILEQELQTLLANYQIAQINTHGFHWNIKGELFFNLHSTLEDLYNDLFTKVDEVAERLLSLGFTPIHTAEQFVEYSNIVSHADVHKHNNIATHVLNDLEIILSQLRKVRNVADEASDNGTVNQMEDFIQQTEKHIWMWSAFLNQ